MSANAIAAGACFSLVIALNVAAGLLPQPTKGALLLAAMFLAGLGWALWIFLEDE